MLKATLASLLAFAAFGAAAADVAQTAQAVIERSNAFRKAHGLEPVAPNAALAQAASRFARFMAQSGKYGHAADGRAPHERAAAQGYEYCIVSENIAWQYRSSGYDSAAVLAEELVTGWKHSPEHRENMVDAHVTETGVGVAQGEGGRYFAVQMFGRPKSAAIRFTVQNRSGERVEYRAGERAFSLPPRAARTHLVCRPTEISISQGAMNFAATARDGARYTVHADKVVSGLTRRN